MKLEKFHEYKIHTKNIRRIHIEFKEVHKLVQIQENGHSNQVKVYYPCSHTNLNKDNKTKELKVQKLLKERRKERKIFKLTNF